jgi:hypothetical protein
MPAIQTTLCNAHLNIMRGTFRSRHDNPLSGKAAAVRAAGGGRQAS